MKLDKYKKPRWTFLIFLAVGVFILFSDIDKIWAIIPFVIAFLVAANAIDRTQKEYLNERINELEKRIDNLERS